MTSPKLTPEIQKTLYAEADARFWAQTGYAPGRKLDPSKPADQKMIPVWADIYNKIRAEWAAGKLITTYDHPAVVALVTEAAHEMNTAAHAIGAALATPPHDPITKNAHADAAQDAHARANDATAKAATYQPPTASPALAQKAADAIAADLSAANDAAARAVAQGIAHAADPIASPPPALVPSPTPHETIDAMAAAHAPAKAAETQTQIPAPDAPKPPATSSTGMAIAVIGGCFATLMLASLLSSTGGRVHVRSTR